MIYLITLTIFVLGLIGLLIALYYRYKNNCYIAKDFINNFSWINIIFLLLLLIYTINLYVDVNIVNRLKSKLIIKNPELSKEEEILIRQNILVYENCILDGFVVKKLSINQNNYEKQQ
jgi:hypothetical protein